MPQFSELYPLLGLRLLTTKLENNRERPPKRVGRPLLLPAMGSKNSAVYNVHSYHTKVPPEAIIPFLRHYTRPGDIILDPFSGSGMTGVACRRLARHAICNDLAPAAAHIAWNVTHSSSSVEFANAANAILSSVTEDVGDYYRTQCASCGGQANLDWMLWGDIVACPNCEAFISLWDVACDHRSGVMASVFKCPVCRHRVVKRGAKRVDSRPVWISLSCPHCGRKERPPLWSDLHVLGRIDSEQIRDWYPNAQVVPDREMYIRSALQLRDITTVADFYTPRNLRVLARLWARIRAWPEPSIRQALALAFTNTAWHGTRMRRFNARGGQRPLTGTLYIPQLSVEVNVLNVYRHKVKQIGHFLEAETDSSSLVAVSVGSATKLRDIPNASIDYVFTDPPFGSNIFYSDCNLIWEAWLDSFTDATDEAVVNRSLRPERGGKSLGDYFEIMVQSFSEIARVLKPRAWATIVFHNGDSEVWEAMREALSASGLSLKAATYLDKKQQSHKGYKGRSGSENVPAFDVVLAIRKCPAAERRRKAPDAKRLSDAKTLIRKHLKRLPPPGTDASADRERSLPFIHSLLLRHHFNGDIGLEVGSYALVRKLCSEHFECDSHGRWVLRKIKASALPAARRGNGG